MARKTIFVSDLTGKTIDEKEAATVTIRYADARRGQVVLDVNANEVADLASKGTKQARRGRKPKSRRRNRRRTPAFRALSSVPPRRRKQNRPAAGLRWTDGPDAARRAGERRQSRAAARPVPRGSLPASRS